MADFEHESHEHLQPRVDFLRSLQELRDIDQLTGEREATLLSQIDAWLAEAQHDPTEFKKRYLQVEKTWIILEKQKNAEGETKNVFSPQQEQLIRRLVKRLEGRTGGGVLFHGIPGTGKSHIVQEIAARLSSIRQNGIRKMSGNPSGPSSELLQKPLVVPRELESVRHVQTLRSIADVPDAEQKTIQLVGFLDQLLTTELKMLSQQRRKGRGYLAQRQLGKIGAEAPDTADLDLSPTFYRNVIEKNGGADQIIKKFIAALHKREQLEKLQGLDRQELGIFYHAILEGDVVIVDEGEELGIAQIIRAFTGLEAVLDPDSSESIVTLPSGQAVERQPDFIALVTVNNLSAIPDKIRRRFEPIHYQPDLNDLIWQARVLLSDEQGNSHLAEKPTEEHALCEFLLWWNALTTHKEVAFNINVLSKLCDLLQKNNSFEEALQTVLEGEPTFKRTYNLYSRNRVGRQSAFAASLFDDTPSLSSNLSLAELNWISNKQSLGSQRNVSTRTQNFPVATVAEPEHFTVSMDQPDVISISQLGEFNPITDSQPQETIAKIDFAGKKPVSKLYSSELAQTALVQLAYNDGNSSQLSVIDLPTGTVVPLTHYTIEQGNVKYESYPNADLLNAHFVSDHQGIVVTRREGKLRISYFTKEYVETTKSNLKVPAAVVTQEILIGPADAQFSITMTDQAILCIDEHNPANSCFVLLSKSSTNIFEKTSLPHHNYKLQQGATGTLLIDEKNHTQRWLKS